MATKSLLPHASTPRSLRQKPFEVTALLALRPLSDGELKRVSRVLAAEGLGDVWPTRIVLTPDDAKAVAAGDERAIPASICVPRVMVATWCELVPSGKSFTRPRRFSDAAVTRALKSEAPSAT